MNIALSWKSRQRHHAYAFKLGPYAKRSPGRRANRRFQMFQRHSLPQSSSTESLRDESAPCIRSGRKSATSSFARKTTPPVSDFADSRGKRNLVYGCAGHVHSRPDPERGCVYRLADFSARAVSVNLTDAGECRYPSHTRIDWLHFGIETFRRRHTCPRAAVGEFYALCIDPIGQRGCQASQ